MEWKYEKYTILKDSSDKKGLTIHSNKECKEEGDFSETVYMRENFLIWWKP
jgi:hypothetical protein